MIASTAPGTMFVPLLFVIVREVFKGSHVKRNTLREADWAPVTIWP
jgi:hypothetical protein